MKPDGVPPRVPGLPTETAWSKGGPNLAKNPTRAPRGRVSTASGPSAAPKPKLGLSHPPPPLETKLQPLENSYAKKQLKKTASRIFDVLANANASKPEDNNSPASPKQSHGIMDPPANQNNTRAEDASILGSPEAKKPERRSYVAASLAPRPARKFSNIQGSHAWSNLASKAPTTKPPPILTKTPVPAPTQSRFGKFGEKFGHRSDKSSRFRGNKSAFSNANPERRVTRDRTDQRGNNTRSDREGDREKHARKERFAEATVPKTRYSLDTLLAHRRNYSPKRPDFVSCGTALITDDEGSNDSDEEVELEEHFKGLFLETPTEPVLWNQFDAKQYNNEWYEIIQRERLEKTKRFNRDHPELASANTNSNPPKLALNLRQNDANKSSPSEGKWRTKRQDPLQADAAVKPFGLADMAENARLFEAERNKDKVKDNALEETQPSAATSVELPSFFEENAPKGVDVDLGALEDEVDRPPEEEIVPTALLQESVQPLDSMPSSAGLTDDFAGTVESNSVLGDKFSAHGFMEFKRQHNQSNLRPPSPPLMHNLQNLQQARGQQAHPELINSQAEQIHQQQQHSQTQRLYQQTNNIQASRNPLYHPHQQSQPQQHLGLQSRHSGVFGGAGGDIFQGQSRGQMNATLQQHNQPLMSQHALRHYPYSDHSVGSGVAAGLGSGINPSNSVGGASSAGVGSSSAVQWFYRDPQGRAQGPFTSAQMRSWLERDYFSPSLLITRDFPTNRYVPLKNAFQNMRLAFLPQPQQPPQVPQHLQQQHHQSHQYHAPRARQELQNPSYSPHLQRELNPPQYQQNFGGPSRQPTQQQQYQQMQHQPPKQHYQTSQGDGMSSLLNGLDSLLPTGNALNSNMNSMNNNIPREIGNNNIMGNLAGNGSHGGVSDMHGVEMGNAPKSRVEEDLDLSFNALKVEMEVPGSQVKETESDRLARDDFKAFEVATQEVETAQERSKPMESQGQSDRLKKMLGLASAGTKATSENNTQINPSHQQQQEPQQSKEVKKTKPTKRTEKVKVKQQKKQVKEPQNTNIQMSQMQQPSDPDSKEANPWKTPVVKKQSSVSLRQIQEEERIKMKKDIANGTYAPPQAKGWASLVAQTAPGGLNPRAGHPSPMQQQQMAMQNRQQASVTKSQREQVEKVVAWCVKQSSGLRHNMLRAGDIAPFFRFCLNLESTAEVREYFGENLGASPEISKFATEFINMKVKLVGPMNGSVAKRG